MQTCTRLVPREIKINLVAYLIISKHNNYININQYEEWANGGTGRRVGLKSQGMENFYRPIQFHTVSNYC